jgi:hypothetical protein
MNAVQKQLGLWFLLASAALSQPNAVVTLGDVQVAHKGDDLLVQMRLSAPAKPIILSAENPHRLILDFPGTLPKTAERIPVNENGMRSIRVAVNSSNPLVTRVVIELDRSHPYDLQTDANGISLVISPIPAARFGKGAPSAGATGGFIGIFRRKQEIPATGDNRTAQPLPAPPPSQSAIAFPNDSQATNRTTADAASHPTAAHPNYGSLQEGTVFPGRGTPGAGQVPSVSGSSGGFDTALSKPPASANSSPTTATGQFDTSRNEGAATQAPASRPVLPTAASVPQSESSLPASHSSEGQMQASSSTSASAASSAKTESEKTQATEPDQGGTAAIVSTAPPLQANPAESEPSTPGSVAENSTGPASTTDTGAQILALQGTDPNLRTVFRVKYVADGVAYLDGGRSQGLAEGMKLEVKDTDVPPSQGAVGNPNDPRVVAELQVSGVADSSAVTDIHAPKRPIKAGDLAYLSEADSAALVQQRTLSATRKYPAVVSFTEGDTLDEEAREEVPKPPLPSVNRARGRIGLDYFGTVSHGTSNITSSDLGLVVRTDITRLKGTYWNVGGYWRGRLQATSGSSAQTLQDLINRTYHLSMTYDNPASAWVAGFGRLYLPYAPSLETIDGGYFGRRIGYGATVGIFGGSTPDPSSYSYNPDQEIGGAFINFDGGSYDDWKYTSTSGVGISAIKFAINRPFVFFENGIFYKRYFSIYDSLQADSPKGNAAVAAPGPGLSRNFLTFRIQPHPRVEFDINENYFRDIPTFDPLLIGTGLLDKYLFQGFSVGGRVEVVKGIFAYTSLGSSNRSGDATSSLNQSYGLTFNKLPKIGLRSDFHYSRFNSSFGSGSYKALTLSRNLSEALRLEVLIGQQNFASTLVNTGRSRFFNANIETTLGSHYFLQGGLGLNRGDLSYDQWHFTLGYRFDSKSKSK